MALSGLKRIFARPRGGVTRVELMIAPSVASANVDTAAGLVRSYAYLGGTPAEYVFCEDAAEYTETVVGQGQQQLVRHTLVMRFPGGEETRRAMAGISANSAGGFVAIITTASGEKLFAGWSHRFTNDYPLLPVGTDSLSGSSPADLPSVTLTLESTDADRSLLLV